MERKTLFISRARADAAFGAEIGRVLEAAGYHVILEQWDFINKNFMDQMQRALAGDARVVALLSPEYLKSDYCSAEWLNAIAPDPLNRNSRIIVLRVAECEPLGLLQGIPYWDLVPIQEQRELVRETVLNAVRAGPVDRGPITGPYWRPPRTIVDAQAVRETPSFTGRENELNELQELLARYGTVTVHGLAGTGKSALAHEYARRNQERYAVVWWLNAASEDGIIEGLLRLGALFVRGLDQLTDRQAAAQQVTSTLLRGFGKPVLLVFDNLEDERFLRDWRPQGEAELLATSRSGDWGGDTDTYELGLWPPEDAARYLSRESRRDDLNNDAGDIITTLGRLPLALAHAAAYLRSYQNVTARGYLAAIDRHLKNAPRHAEYPASVFATFQAATASAEREVPGAAAVLCLAGYFAADAIPEELFRQNAEVYPEELRPKLPGTSAPVRALRATVADPAGVEEALGTLNRFSLIDFATTTRTFTIHRLVQAAARDLLGDAYLPWVQSAIMAADAAFPWVEFATWPTCQRLLAHARAAIDALPANENIPSAARLASKCGHYSLERAAFAEAEPLMRRALAIDEASSGPQHPDVAIRLNDLAVLLQDTNRLAEAEPLHRRALAISEKALGPDHPDVAIRLDNLASLLQAANRLAEAEPLMRRALAIAEASYGVDHPDVAIRLTILARLLQATNRLAEAEPLHRRALAIAEAGYGADHPTVAACLSNLAGLLKATNRLAEAEPLMRRALAIEEASRGPQHPYVASNLNNLAQLLRATNRLAEAEPLMRRALAISEASYGPDHPAVAIRLNNLALLLQATNRLAEAEPLLHRALAIDEASYGADHPDVAIRLNNLALLLQATNRLAEAEPLMRRALAIDEASYGPDHPDIATDLNNLAQLLQARNRLAEAESLMRRALAILETSYGSQHPYVVMVRDHLARF